MLEISEKLNLKKLFAIVGFVVGVVCTLAPKVNDWGYSSSPCNRRHHCFTGRGSHPRSQFNNWSKPSQRLTRNRNSKIHGFWHCCCSLYCPSFSRHCHCQRFNAAEFGAGRSFIRVCSLIQYAVPPAMNMGTTTQMFGTGETECSVIMLWTYALASVSLTLWCTFFLWLAASSI
ncbi:uncharacterized protein LOC141698313 [Apium graveolens]|uniref:uncharacterized protein LOC141698313 n=1 Tax=Apium graveolens TaxID=4045 RepID=UPI003D7A5E51